MPASVRLLRIGTAIAAASILLSGCSATPPSEPSPSPSVEPAMAEISMFGPAITGTGTTPPPGVTLPVPEGDFHSVSLAVDCVGDVSFHIGISDPMGFGLSLQRGTCGETTTFEQPLTPSTEKSLFVATADGIAWSITPTFSTAEFVVDPAIAADCEAFSKPYSMIYNADIGYSRYDDVDEAEWNSRIDTAADALSDLADSSTSHPAEPFADLVPILKDPQRVLGDVMSAMAEQSAAISEICGANQTPVTFEADYGA